jgi:hypothetical protein
MNRTQEIQAQIETLIANSPQDQQTLAGVKAIAPALEQMAERLKYPAYCILQSLDQRWRTTTLKHRQQTTQEKTVIYAYANRQDAIMAGQSWQNEQLLAVSQPIIQLLFQMLSLEGVDSLIFLEDSGNLNVGKEIFRHEIQQAVHVQLQKLVQPTPPPDLA